MTHVVFSASTPIDEYHTRQFGQQARNSMLEPEHDQERLDGRKQAISEDIGVVSHVRPMIGPTPFKDEFLVKADEMETIFRGLVMEMVECGWEIDYQKVRADWDHKVYVIPCPARREDPKGWVHEAVPTTRPRKTDGWKKIAADAGKVTRSPALAAE